MTSQFVKHVNLFVLPKDFRQLGKQSAYLEQIDRKAGRIHFPVEFSTNHFSGTDEQRNLLAIVCVGVVTSHGPQ